MKKAGLLIVMLMWMLGSLSAETIRFVCIGDPQMEMTDAPGLDKQFFQLTVSEVNNLNPPAGFALLLGDMVQGSTDDGQWADYFEVTAGFTIPFYEVMGNHDGWNTDGLDRWRNTWGKQDYYSFTYEGLFFMGLNSMFLVNPDELPAETAVQKAFIDAELAANGSNPHKFMFQHFPLYKDDPEEPLDDGRYVPPAERAYLLNHIDTYGMTAVISGHRHQEIVNDYNGTLLLSCNPNARTLGNGKRGYYIMDYDKDTQLLSYQFIENTQERLDAFLAGGGAETLANTTTHTNDCGGLQGGKEIGYIHDGNTNTPTAKAADHIWVEYNFGAEYKLSSARVFGDNDGSWNSQNWALQAWDGSSYVTVFTNSVCFGSQWFEETFDVTASRVKVIVNGTATGTEVFEVEIIGEVETGLLAAWDFAGNGNDSVPEGWTTWETSSITNLGASITTGGLTLTHTAGTMEVKSTTPDVIAELAAPLITGNADVLNDYLRINNDQKLTLSGLTAGQTYRIQFTGNCLMHTNGDRNALIVMDGSTSNFLFGASSSGDHEAGYSPYFTFNATAGDTDVVFDFSKAPSASGASTGVSGMIVEGTIESISGYDAWVIAEGIIGTPLEDDDSDGLNNLSEYAIKDKPVMMKSGNTFNYVYKQRTDDPNLIYTLETCADLASGLWTNTGYTVLGTHVTGGSYDDVTNSIPTTASQTYIRLRLENP